MKYIENSKDYFVGKDGFIYRKGKKLSGNKSNYYKVRIWYKDGTSKEHFVHRLIASAYIPNPENKPIVNHIDGNKFNNSATNLEWVTAKENTQHALQMGLIKTGFDHQNAVLTEEMVHEICEYFTAGHRVVDVVKKFGISQPLASNIYTGVKYSDISEGYVFPKREECYSEETIRWVCERLQEGLRLKGILGLTTNKKINKGLLDGILSRRVYKNISKDYKF